MKASDKVIKMMVLNMCIEYKKLFKYAFFCRKEKEFKICKNLKEVSGFLNISETTAKYYSSRKKSIIPEGLFFKIDVLEYLKMIKKELKK